MNSLVCTEDNIKVNSSVLLHDTVVVVINCTKFVNVIVCSVNSQEFTIMSLKVELATMFHCYWSTMSDQRLTRYVSNYQYERIANINRVQDIHLGYNNHLITCYHPVFLHRLTLGNR